VGGDCLASLSEQECIIAHQVVSRENWSNIFVVYCSIMIGETNFLDCMAKWNVNSHQLVLLKSPHNDFLWALAVNSLKLLASHIAKFTAWKWRMRLLVHY
jgi:hypothetical protein